MTSAYGEFANVNFEWIGAQQTAYQSRKVINMIALSPNHKFLQQLGFPPIDQQHKNLQLNVLGITQNLILSFRTESTSVLDVLNKFQSDAANYSDAVYDNIRSFLGNGDPEIANSSKSLDAEDALSLFQACFESIHIYGCKISSSPPPPFVQEISICIMGIGLMNIINVFKKASRDMESIESEFLSGLCSMNCRKFVQASESFGKVGQYYLREYLTSKKPNKSILLKAAKMEMLIALSCVGLSQQKMKLQALRKAAELFSGKIEENIYPSCNANQTISSDGTEAHHSNKQIADTEEILLMHSNGLCELALKCLMDKNESVKFAGVKTMQLLIEELGCSLGNKLSRILQVLIQTYPEVRSQQKDDDAEEEEGDDDDDDDGDDRFAYRDDAFSNGSSYPHSSSNSFDNGKMSNSFLEMHLESRSNGDIDGHFISKIASLGQVRTPDNRITTSKRNNSLEENSISEKHITEAVECLKGLKREDRIQGLNRPGQGNKKQAYYHRKSIQEEEEQAEYEHKSSRDDFNGSKKLRINYISRQGFFMIQDAYHELLEAFISVLASASSQILRGIFERVLLDQLFSKEINIDLKPFLLRIAEKILSICQGDVQIPDNFFGWIVEALEETTSLSERTVFELGKLWETIKLKLVYNMEGNRLNGLIRWISSSMLRLLEEDRLHPGSTLGLIFSLLDIVTIISIRHHQQYSSNFSISQQQQKSKGPQKDISNIQANDQQAQSPSADDEANSSNSASNMVQKYFSKIDQSKNLRFFDGSVKISIETLITPLILWLDNSLAYQTQLDVFKNIYLSILEILPNSSSISLFSIAKPLLQQLQLHFSHTSPTLSMLQFLLLILSSLRQHQKEYPRGAKFSKEKQQINDSQEQFFIEFLTEFCDIIPQTSYPEAFEAFEYLLMISQSGLNTKLICKCLESLCDKFTLKNSASERVRNSLIKELMAHENQALFSQMFKAIVVDSNPYCEVLGMQNKKKNLLEVEEEQERFKGGKGLNNKDVMHQALPGNGNRHNSCMIRRKTRKRDSKQLGLDSAMFFAQLLFLQDTLEQVRFVHFSSFSELFLDNAFILAFSSYDLHCKFFLKQLGLLRSKNSKLRGVAIILAKSVLEKYIVALVSSKQSAADQKANAVNGEDSMEHCSSFFKKEETAPKDISSLELLLARFVLIVCSEAFRHQADCHLQFQTLLILDLLFQTLLCSSSLRDRIIIPAEMTGSADDKNQHDSSSSSQEMQGLLNMLSSSNSSSPLLNLSTIPEIISRDSSLYQNFRLQEIQQLLPEMRRLLNSSWSNIRSLSYGLLCYWVKPQQCNISESNLSSTSQSYNQEIFEIIECLLISEESECRTGGLNVLGSLCGLGYNFDNVMDSSRLIQIFRQNERRVPETIWERIFQMQFDWDTTNQAAALALVQLCAPQEKIKQLYMKNQELRYQEDQQNAFWNTTLSQLEEFTDVLQVYIPENFVEEIDALKRETEQSLENIFWVEQLGIEDLKDYISMFRNEYKVTK